MVLQQGLHRDDLSMSLAPQEPTYYPWQANKCELIVAKECRLARDVVFGLLTWCQEKRSGPWKWKEVQEK